MKSFKAFKEEQMKDPEFAKAYRDLEPEMNFIRALADARTGQNLTQKELAERTGIAQTEISKIEKLEDGVGIPNEETLQAIHDVLQGKNLSRTFGSVEEMMKDLND